MKKIFPFIVLCAAISTFTGASFAAEYNDPVSNAVYPSSIQEYFHGDSPRINKVYILNTGQSPSIIPVQNFERDGISYALLDVTQEVKVEVDSKTIVETIAFESKTKDISEIIQQLDPAMGIVTEDGFSGTLTLDTSGIQAQVKSYGTSNRSVSATRTYPSLSDADVSLLPKSIEENGRTLELSNVTWNASGAFFTATATYSTTATSRYATGYLITATYTGEVTKVLQDEIIYTAIFGGTNIQTEQPDKHGPVDFIMWALILSVAVLLALGIFISKKFRRNRV